MPHTSAFKCNYKSETAHASGGGATADSPQELVEADLTAIDKMVAFDPGIPKPQREQIFHLASGLTPSDEITTGVVSKGGSLQAYFQTSILYDWAVSPTIGAMGTSKAFRCYSPFRAAEYDIYGCLCKKWELDCQPRKAIMQNVEFTVAQSKTASITPIAGGGIKAFSTAAIKTWKDIATCTVDSKTIANLNISSLKYTVENTFDEENTHQFASDYVIFQPIAEQDVSFEIGFRTNDSQTWDADELNIVAQTVAAVFNLSVFTLTLANMDVWETDQEALKQRGVVKRTATFKRGIGATYTKS